jgi:RHS repeat-associated protein
MKLRVLFHSVSTESCTSFNTTWDYAYLTDSLGNNLGVPSIGGYHRGSKWSDWVGVPSDGKVDVRFYSDSNNCQPTADGCVNCAVTASYPYSGVTLEAYEYQRFESGASPAWLPLRFPGQYHDAETDLFENWNRYYDPGTGRYLQPEPLLQSGSYLRDQSSQGVTSIPPYAYAQNNPIAYSDPTGFEVAPEKSCEESVSKMLDKMKRALESNKGCRCLSNLKMLRVYDMIVKKEPIYRMACSVNKFKETSEYANGCGFGKGYKIGVSSAPGCACFPKLLIHELLHATPSDMVHEIDDKPKQGPDLIFFGDVAKCFNCDGSISEI